MMCLHDPKCRGPIPRIPNRFFYSSSYDRGLVQLLEVWPSIKEAYPDAELHVAYGLDTARNLLRQTGELDKLHAMEELAEALVTTDGVVHHERLSQNELAELQLSCEAWLYPPHHFLETYCISALEAQAAGCIPISRSNGALSETLHKYVEWKEGDDIVALIKKAKNFKHIQENREWALSQTWASLAVDWIGELITPKE